MEEFRVCATTSDETLECLLSNRTATGLLFLQADHDFFPANRWNDFVVVVLNWWIANAISLDETVIEVDNRFMDGPYSYRVRREPGADTVSITFVRDGKYELYKKLEISYKDYLNSLHKGAENFLNEIGNVSNKDIEELRGKLKRLASLERDLDM